MARRTVGDLAVREGSAPFLKVRRESVTSRSLARGHQLPSAAAKSTPWRRPAALVEVTSDRSILRDDDVRHWDHLARLIHPALVLSRRLVIGNPQGRRTVTASLDNIGSRDLGGSDASATLHAGDSQRGVPSVYCHSLIPAAKFAFWSYARRLLSADCPACARRVTVAASTWRRWLRSSSTSTTHSRPIAVEERDLRP
jgi:hypothetical protein